MSNMLELAGRRVLVVEDSPEMQELIRGCLEAEGLKVITAATAGACVRQMALQRPDIVLLDLNLPDEDGLDLARRLKLGDAVPLIFVTARDSEEDRVAGLEHGGDYITKPVSPRELLARIRNALRRAPPVDAPLTFHGWTLDLVRRALFRPDGSYLALTTGEFNILAALAVMRPNPVEREYLLDVIGSRDPSAISEHTVNTLITRLRRKMTLDDGRQIPILTVRGVGYALADDSGV